LGEERKVVVHFFSWGLGFSNRIGLGAEHPHRDPTPQLILKENISNSKKVTI